MLYDVSFTVPAFPLLILLASYSIVDNSGS
jgi:hypothetical protein